MKVHLTEQGNSMMSSDCSCARASVPAARWAGLLGAACFALTPLQGALAHSAQGYPAKPMRIIIPSAPVGPSDTNGRGVAQALSEALGQPFVVDNRPGADGIIGAEACVRSAPDGYTLCTCDGQGFSLNPVIRAKMPYDPLRDLSPVIQTAFLNSALVIHPSVPANSVSELLDLAKTKPGLITYGTSGLASVANIYVQWLKKAKGVEFQGVPYKGITQAFKGLVAGEVQVANFAVGQVAQYIKAGKIKALGQTGETRSRHLPDVPTCKEAGMGIALRNWFGLFAPAGTPRDIVQRLNAEVSRNLLNNPVLQERFLISQGLSAESPVGESPEAFAAFLKADREYFATVIKAAGIKLD